MDGLRGGDAVSAAVRLYTIKHERTNVAPRRYDFQIQAIHLVKTAKPEPVDALISGSPRARSSTRPRHISYARPVRPKPITNRAGHLEYYVERILHSRRNGSKWEYRVGWLGYGENHNS